MLKKVKEVHEKVSENPIIKLPNIYSYSFRESSILAKMRIREDGIIEIIDPIEVKILQHIRKHRI